MSSISVKTQGVKGGSIQYKEKIGYVTTFLRHSEDFIAVDDFEGHGNSYKKRELTEIRIVQNGVVLFSGTKYELFEILKK